MDETIYRLVPSEPPVQVKPTIYKSKHDPRYMLVGSTLGIHGTTQPLGAAAIKKELSRTFGRPILALRNDPAMFLKRGARTRKGPKEAKPSHTKGSKFTYHNGGRKAPVPRRNECPVMGILSKANFVTANAVDTILAVPRRVTKLKPNYLKKEDYGKVPGYLEQVKDEISRENTMIETFVREQMGLEADESGGFGVENDHVAFPAVPAPVVTPDKKITDREEHLDEMQERERDELVDLLKAKWDSINKKYQLLAHVVNLDTFGKLRRKEQMEKQLKALESDIEKLGKAQVFVRP